jgi:signal transduction histidine kinase/CheY-like chemotaxis protein/purine-cytosine permease-like protein
MTGRQRIARVRRQYNQWVGNQTLEDYALRFTAHGARRWSLFRVSNTALGAISFLACEAIGGSLTLAYGFNNTVAAILAVGALIFLTGLPIGYYASKYGVDVDLLTRGAGFGYIGSTITSLIYASFTFLLFSVEAVIMALALEMWFGMPLWAAYIVCAIVVIPIVTYGIRLISGLQLWTQPIWLVLQILPLAYIAMSDHAAIQDWTRFTGRQGGGELDLLLFGIAASTLLSFAPQIGEQADYLRFLPAAKPGLRHRIAWWAALLPAGPGWIFIGAVKLLAGSFLAVLALRHGVAPERAAEPTQLFRVAFEAMHLSPQMAIVLTGIFVITCQIKINVTNVYAGSIAWSNFFSRLTHSHPGRVVWVVFNVLLALLLMEMGIFSAIEKILTLYSNFAVAWIGALVADLVINKPLGLSPKGIEFRRAHLYDINPVGVGAMLISIICSTTAYFGLLGLAAQALAPFIGLFVAMGAAPVIAYWTKGRYYIARAAETQWNDQAELRCCICEHVFEREDMSHCPAYAGPICSLCCTLDARCHDRCKVNSRFTDQMQLVLHKLLPARLALGFNSRLARFAGLFVTFNLVIGATLLLIGLFQKTAGGGNLAAVHTTLVSAYFALIGISGVVAWLMVLAHESRSVAEEETDRQTQMLTNEIEAHERTAAQLQKAKIAAESANLAKSRYIVGVSHEIRAPLNAIFGYAQLMERNPALPAQQQDAVRVIRRSSEHLSTLVDGLLDIAKIEAGRLQLNRDRIAIGELLEQIVDMFRIQAKAKGIEFRYETTASLPRYVHADEKRLRQILINLLSNAVKYTHEGYAALRVRYRGQVCEIEVADTGIGIIAVDLVRIFEPFERGSMPGALAVPGTGLGLTITKLLTEIMGGEISVESTSGQGSAFRVRLMLSPAPAPLIPVIQERRIKGYEGPRLTIVAADDDSSHLDLLRELLTPIGFELHTTLDGVSCIQLAATVAPDLALVDLSMAGKSGWEVARALREMNGMRIAIIIVSANVDEQSKVRELAHTSFIAKPIDVQLLLTAIQTALKLEWIYEDLPAPSTPEPRSQDTPAQRVAPAPFPPQHLSDLHQLGTIGYIRGIEAKLDEIAESEPAHRVIVADLRMLVRSFELKRYMATLEALRDGPSA